MLERMSSKCPVNLKTCASRLHLSNEQNNEPSMSLVHFCACFYIPKSGLEMTIMCTIWYDRRAGIKFAAIHFHHLKEADFIKVSWSYFSVSQKQKKMSRVDITYSIFAAHLHLQYEQFLKSLWKKKFSYTSHLHSFILCYFQHFWCISPPLISIIFDIFMQRCKNLQFHRCV